MDSTVIQSMQQHTEQYFWFSLQFPLQLPRTAPSPCIESTSIVLFFHEMTCFHTLSAWINFSSTPPKNSFQPTLFIPPCPPSSNSCCVTRFNHSHGRHCSILTRVNRRLFVKIYLNPQSHWDEMLPFIQTWALSRSGRVSTPAICEAAGEEHQ